MKREVIIADLWAKFMEVNHLLSKAQDLIKEKDVKRLIKLNKRMIKRLNEVINETK